MESAQNQQPFKQLFTRHATRCCFVRVFGCRSGQNLSPNYVWTAEIIAEIDLLEWREKLCISFTFYRKLMFMIRPSGPSSPPASGVAKATAQNPDTSGKVNQVVPSSGVHAADPVENEGGSLAVITTARPRLFPPPLPVRPT